MKIAEIYEAGFRLKKLWFASPRSKFDAVGTVLLTNIDTDLIYTAQIFERGGEWLFHEPVAVARKKSTFFD